MLMQQSEEVWDFEFYLLTDSEVIQSQILYSI